MIHHPASKGPSAVTIPHECIGCGSEIPALRLMHRAEWQALPEWLRAALWRSWDSGRAAGSPEHRAAVAEALAALQPINENG